MPEPAKKTAAGLIAMVVLTAVVVLIAVVLTAIAMLAVAMMLAVMVMLVISTTWPGRRKCHALRMPATSRCIIVEGSGAGMPLTAALATMPRALPLRESLRQRDRH